MATSATPEKVCLHDSRSTEIVLGELTGKGSGTLLSTLLSIFTDLEKSRDRCNTAEEGIAEIASQNPKGPCASPVPAAASAAAAPLSHVEGPATDTQGFCAHFSCGKHRHPNCRLYSFNRIRHLGTSSLCLGYSNSGPRHLTLNLFRNPHHVYSSLRDALSESEQRSGPVHGGCTASNTNHVQSVDADHYGLGA